MSPSQAEQDLANALSAGNDLDSLEDDFDDELLLNNEFSADLLIVIAPGADRPRPHMLANRKLMTVLRAAPIVGVVVAGVDIELK